MLLNLHKKKWTDGLTLRRFDTHSKTNEQTVQVSQGLICRIWIRELVGPVTQRWILENARQDPLLTHVFIWCPCFPN